MSLNTSTDIGHFLAAENKAAGLTVLGALSYVDAQTAPVDPAVALNQLLANLGLQTSITSGVPGSYSLDLYSEFSSIDLKKLTNPSGWEFDLEFGTLAHNGTIFLDGNNQSISDLSGWPSIDILNRTLSTSIGSVLDWQNGMCYDTLSNLPSVDFGYSRQLYSSLGTPTVDWEFMFLNDQDNRPSISWGDRFLYANDGSNDYPIAHWGHDAVSAYFDVESGGYFSVGGSAGLTETIDLTTATSLTVTGGIITGYA